MISNREIGVGVTVVVYQKAADDNHIWFVVVCLVAPKQVASNKRQLKPQARM